MNFANKKAEKFPPIINVEVFRGECPCSCIHCPVGETEHALRKKRFGLGAIEIPLFFKIVNEMKNFPHSVLRVHGVGEPLLWSGLSEMLSSIYQKFDRIWFFTSAMIKDKELLLKLCNSGGIIEVSVNSTSRQDYLNTKGVDAFDLVLENIKFMKKNISGKTRLIVSRVESKDLELNKQFVTYWSSLVDEVFVRSFHNYNNLLKGEPQENRKKGPCLVHWSRFNIALNGDVAVCFNELFKPKLAPSLILGNVQRESIASIWHKKCLEEIRESELSGNCIPYLPCKDCKFCQPLNTTSITSEHQIAKWKNR